MEAPVEVNNRVEKWRKRVRFALVFLLVAILLGIWLTTPPPEPQYQGKSLSQWIERCERVLDKWEGPNREQQVSECHEAFRQMGTNAISPLLRILRAKDPPFKMELINLLGRQSFISVPFSSVENEKDKALEGFLLLGPLATNAMADLLDIYKHPSSDYSRSIADETLKRLYPEPCVAVPHWIPEAARADWYVEAGTLLMQGHEYGALPSGATNAVLAFSQALKLEPGNTNIYRSRSLAAFSSQNHRMAEQDLNLVLSSSPDDEVMLFLLGHCRLQLRQFAQAKADFTRVLILDTNDSLAYQGRGVAHLYLNQLEAAITDLNQAITLKPDMADAYYQRAAAKARQRELEAALMDATHSVRLAARDPTAHTVLGRVKCALRDYEGALNDFERSVELGPHIPEGYAARAMCRIYRDQLELAAPDITKALQLNADSVTAIFTRAVLKAKQGDDGAALADFAKAAELESETPELRGTLGQFQYKVRQWKPALDNCQAALAQGIAQEVSDLNCTIWLIRSQSGEREHADRDLRQYLQSLAADKTNQWSAVTARFFIGELTESQFLELATTSAKRASDVPDQVSESLYYAGMKRKVAGDAAAALNLFQRCLDTRFSNNFAYLNAKAELAAAGKR